MAKQMLSPYLKTFSPNYHQLAQNRPDATLAREHLIGITPLIFNPILMIFFKCCFLGTNRNVTITKLYYLELNIGFGPRFLL